MVNMEKVAARNSTLSRLVGTAPLDAMKRRSLRISNIDIDAFRVVIDHIYNTQPPPINVRTNNAMDIMHVATAFDLPDLIAHCIAYLKCKINLLNVCWIFQQSIDLRNEITDYCFRMISANISYFMEGRRLFNSLDAGAMRVVFHEDNIHNLGPFNEYLLIIDFFAWAKRAIRVKALVELERFYFDQAARQTELIEAIVTPNRTMYELFNMSYLIMDRIRAEIESAEQVDVSMAELRHFLADYLHFIDWRYVDAEHFAHNKDLQTYVLLERQDYVTRVCMSRMVPIINGDNKEAVEAANYYGDQTRPTMRTVAQEFLDAVQTDGYEYGVYEQSIYIRLINPFTYGGSSSSSDDDSQ